MLFIIKAVSRENKEMYGMYQDRIKINWEQLLFIKLATLLLGMM
jgi:hypothetical protein